VYRKSYQLSLRAAARGDGAAPRRRRRV